MFRLFWKGCFDTEKLRNYCTFKSNYFIFQNKLVSKDQSVPNRRIRLLSVEFLMSVKSQNIRESRGIGLYLKNSQKSLIILARPKKVREGIYSMAIIESEMISHEQLILFSQEHKQGNTGNSAQWLLGSSRSQQLLLGSICRQLALSEICQQMLTQLKVCRQSYCIQLSKILPNGNIWNCIQEVAMLGFLWKAEQTGSAKGEQNALRKVRPPKKPWWNLIPKWKLYKYLFYLRSQNSFFIFLSHSSDVPGLPIDWESLNF